MFRKFADATKCDLKAMAACIRGARQPLSEAEARRIDIPVLVAVGTADEVAGDPHRLAALFPLAKRSRFQAATIIARSGTRSIKRARCVFWRNAPEDG